MTTSTPSPARCIAPVASAAAEANLPISDRALALALDKADPLAPLRKEYNIPGSSEGAAYICAHALGPQPKKVGALLQEEVEAWATVGIHGHTNHPSGKHWTLGKGLDERGVDVMADIVGALPSEVTLMGGLTGNLHVMMTSFYRPDVASGRTKIIFEANAFPSDLFAFDSQVRLHDLDPASALVGLHPRAGEHYLRTEDIIAAIEEHGDTTAVVLFSAVHWYSGQLFDMEQITKKGQEKGCIVGWDCAHAAGNALLQLRDWNVDFAVWCNYKYLNSGPGATASIFVHERHFDRLRLAGWWGHELASRFGSTVPFKPRLGAAGFALNNPSLFATVPVHASMEILRTIPSLCSNSTITSPSPLSTIMPHVSSKSTLLTGYLEALLTSPIVMGDSASRLRVISPPEPEERAACLSVLFLPREGDEDKGDAVTYSRTLVEVFEALKKAGIIVDKRAPDLIRFAPSALYNTFDEMWRTAMAVKEALV
ncbi:pyridoxal phosphate-dependent transferase [Leucosporidium creatinivorum]|uniref:Kynureninase n=1 Tax=Leucosporidium creatinivorum TaxID=106004 RepID=A0A1Y2FY96_9BASI|nr:pyridoxal phosphate-dependent transferase [Leucosporidium creatinivorum]